MTVSTVTISTSVPKVPMSVQPTPSAPIPLVHTTVNVIRDTLAMVMSVSKTRKKHVTLHAVTIHSVMGTRNVSALLDTKWLMKNALISMSVTK